MFVSQSRSVQAMNNIILRSLMDRRDQDVLMDRRDQDVDDSDDDWINGMPD